MSSQPIARLLLGLTLVSLLSACATPPTPFNPPTVTITPTSAVSTLTLTRTLSPTATPEPTATFIPPTAISPTATPFPPLQTEGPYLVYAKQTVGEGRWSTVITGSLTIMDADGRGRETISIPEAGVVYDLAASLSPNGQWLAFYTGTAGEWDEKAIGPFDLTLNLLHLADGQIRVVTPLLSADYPDNFLKVAEQLPERELAYFLSTAEAAIGIRYAFWEGIHSLEWSPDSRYLAFAGEMDGLSSDLYVYDPLNQTTHRLTDGLEQIQHLSWSPDSQWIMHGSQNFTGMGSFPNFYAAKADGSSVIAFDYNGLGAGWVSLSQYVVQYAANGPGDFDLYILDVVTRKTIAVWPDAFNDYAIDAENNLAIVNASFSMNEAINPNAAIEPGLYMVNMNTGESQFIFPTIPSWLGFWGNEVYRFISVNTEGTSVIAADGSVIQISEQSLRPSISPDRRWLILGSEVFNANANLVRTITKTPSSRSVWRPDSSGLFFLSGTALYYMSVPDGEPIKVDEGFAADSYTFPYTWIAGK